MIFNNVPLMTAWLPALCSLNPLIFTFLIIPTGHSMEGEENIDGKFILIIMDVPWHDIFNDHA